MKLSEWIPQNIGELHQVGMQERVMLDFSQLEDSWGKEPDTGKNPAPPAKYAIISRDDQ
jgi:hypothetical protein